MQLDKLLLLTELFLCSDISLYLVLVHHNGNQ